MTDTRVVIDTGSYKVKCGYAGDFAPVYIDNNVVGKLIGQGHYVGSSCLKSIGQMDRTYPMKGGLIQDMDAMIEVWSSLQYGLHPCDDPENNFKDASVMLSEKFFNPESLTTRTFEVFFEHFNASHVSVVNDAVCACLISARTTGVVL
eukprot:PhF_6_TR35428/c0_g1_i3/m.51612/K16575/ACTR1, ARP1; centractin